MFKSKEELYGKEVVAFQYVLLMNLDCNVYVCIDKEHKYYDVHILMREYQEDEMNTLEQQIGIDDMKESDFDEMYLTILGLKRLLWHKFYGEGGNLHSFDIQVISEPLNKEG